MPLTDRQLEQLFKEINPSRVSKLQGKFSYVEEWDVQAHLIRIFGFEGWDQEIEYRLAYEDDAAPFDAKTAKWCVGYTAKCRLTIRDPHGSVVCVHEDAAAGDAVNQPSRGDAHHLAVTTAVSTALKRAAKGLGNQFGLSLYDDGSTKSVVGKSLAYPTPPDVSDATLGDPTVLRERVAEVRDRMLGEAVGTE